MRPSHTLYLLFLMITLATSAQIAMGSRPAAVPPQWQELTKDEDFGYRDEKEMQPPKKANVQQNALSKAFGILVGFFSTGVGKALIWTCLFLLLAYTLFKAFVSDKTGLFRKRETAVNQTAPDTGATPEDLLSTNWEHYLEQAIGAGDMRLAVRYSYMQLLQLLQEQHWIHYRQDKTNYDYYQELGNNAFRQPFMQLTRQYEYAWYGNYPLAKDKYEGYMDTFRSLKSALYHS